jgi:predicted PurR-regulated permease PerM
MVRPDHDKAFELGMTADSATRGMLALCTAILMAAALYLGQSIFAPVAFSFFAIAVVWPLQRALQAKMPKLAALVVTLMVTLIALAVFGLAIAWGEQSGRSMALEKS